MSIVLLLSQCQRFFTANHIFTKQANIAGANMGLLGLGAVRVTSDWIELQTLAKVGWGG